jgi:putative DNA primase/helicase
MIAADIAAALGGGYCSGEWHRCICPLHQSSGPTLAQRDGPRGLIAHCHAGCSRDDVLAELHRLGLLDGNGERTRCVPDPAEMERRRAAEQRERRRRIAEALDVWRHETLPIAPGTIVERYWRARKLALPVPPTIRASRSWLRHPEGGSRPVMVALVEHVAFGPVAVHRTFLAIDGSCKAAFQAPRLSLGPVGGGAIRLGEAREDVPLVVAEGVENASSVMLVMGWPGWAALSAGGIERLILPPLPLAAEVFIAADNDPNGSGERAAWVAAGRWIAEGRRVRIALPPEPGTDWNDVLLGKDRKDIRKARHAA